MKKEGIASRSKNTSAQAEFTHALLKKFDKISLSAYNTSRTRSSCDFQDPFYSTNINSKKSKIQPVNLIKR